MKKKFVRNGIRTHALLRGPECPYGCYTVAQDLHLESGALDQLGHPDNYEMW